MEVFVELLTIEYRFINVTNRFYHACEICGHPFATVHDKIDHLEGHVEHATTQCCYCHLCKRRFDCLEDFFRHQRLHGGACFICGKRNKGLRHACEHLMYHINCHTFQVGSLTLFLFDSFQLKWKCPSLGIAPFSSDTFGTTYFKQVKPRFTTTSRATKSIKKFKKNHLNLSKNRQNSKISITNLEGSPGMRSPQVWGVPRYEGSPGTRGPQVRGVPRYEGSPGTRGPQVWGVPKYKPQTSN